MFDNIGNKIMVLAKVVCWIGIIASIVAGVAAIVAAHGYLEYIIGGVLLMIAGCILSWVSAFVLYGFGKLVDNSEIMVNHKR